MFYFLKINKFVFNNNKQEKTLNTNNFKLNIKDIFNYNITNKSILIIELYNYHYECTPGFSKYFIDLGYNVDIIMNSFGNDSFCLFEKKQNIKLFIYNNTKELIINSEKLAKIFNKYNYLLLQTTDYALDLCKKLNLFNLTNIFFVFHNVYPEKIIKMKDFYKPYRIWGLGNFKYLLQVNPHYFGNIKLKEKNEITKFFITSSPSRNYKYLISTIEKLKKEKYKFEVIVTGHFNLFPLKNISKNILDNSTLIIKYKISYLDLFKLVKESDYIIINLDPDINSNLRYNKSKISGSAQLSYGFLKPVLINKQFADFYLFNDKNSFLYDNDNFYNVMRDAILLNNKKYKEMQSNLKKVSDYIYNLSFNNVKKALKNIL